MYRLPPPGEGGPLPVLPPPKKRYELRRRMGVTQKDAAEHLGVSANSFGYWERGDRQPDPVHIRVYYSQLYAWQQAVNGMPSGKDYVLAGE